MGKPLTPLDTRSRCSSRGVTYHDLQVEQTLDDEWQATVVFDI